MVSLEEEWSVLEHWGLTAALGGQGRGHLTMARATCCCSIALLDLAVGTARGPR